MLGGLPSEVEFSQAFNSLSAKTRDKIASFLQKNFRSLCLAELIKYIVKNPEVLIQRISKSCALEKAEINKSELITHRSFHFNVPISIAMGWLIEIQKRLYNL